MLDIDYTYIQGIDVPLSASKDHIIDLILGHQARVLTERAQKAIHQIRGNHQPGHDDILSIDPSTLQPLSTAYSTSGGTRSEGSGTGSSPSSVTDQATSESIRSRVLKQMKLRKVCVCVRGRGGVYRGGSKVREYFVYRDGHGLGPYIWPITVSVSI